MTSARSSTSAWSPVSARRDALAQVALRSSGCGAVRGDRRRLARRGHRAAGAARAGTGAGPPLLVGDEGDASGPARASRRRPAGAGRDDARSGAGKQRCMQLARGRLRRRAGVQAAEEALHEPARDLRGDEPLGGRVERADVERPRVAQRRREARSARTARARGRSRRRRSSSSSSIVRATSTGGEARPGAPAEGQQLAHAEHAHPVQRAPRRRARRAASRARGRASATVRRSRPRARAARARSEVSRMKALTSCASSQAYGETCAMRERHRHRGLVARARAPRLEAVSRLGLPSLRALGLDRRLARVLGDELLGLLARLVVGALVCAATS